MGNDEESSQEKYMSVSLHSIKNCQHADVTHVALPYAVPFKYQNKHLFLRHLYVAANGILALSSRELQLDWIQFLVNPSVAREFPSDLQVILLPLWTVKANYTDYEFTSICAENISPMSVEYSKTHEYVQSLLKQDKTTLMKSLLQFTIITWRGHIIHPTSGVYEDIEFQTILATDFDSTFLIYIYGNLGSGLELVSSSYAILRGYAINDPTSLKQR